MNTISKRVVLSVFAISLMLLGMTLLPVKAAVIQTQLETMEQSTIADENGHTYVYAEPFEDVTQWAFHNLVHDEDVDVTKYYYQSTSWFTESDSFMGPASRDSWEGFYGVEGFGWLDDFRVHPSFTDYANTSSDPLSISFESERVVFPIDVEAETTIIMEPGTLHYGTFNLTTEEFMYLTVGSRTDLVEAEFVLVDPNGTILFDGYIWGGNIELFPFKASGPGMYTLLINLYTLDDNLCIFDFNLEAVTPIDLPIGDYAEGVLNGSEYYKDPEDGSVIHQERPPEAVTYMFSTNFTTPGVITHSMNLPELDDDIYIWYEPWFHITSDVLDNFFWDTRYVDYFGPNDYPYYYQSFQNETYYLTVVGMENVEYMLHNDYAMIDELPVNEKFYIENGIVDEEMKAYTLSLSQDSVLRVNSTEGTYGYNWGIFSVFDDNNYQSLSIQDHSSFSAAKFYYLPAGEYIVRATCSDEAAWGFYDFNLGPVIDGLGSVSVDVGSVVGLRFDTNVLDWYNVSLSFDTHDNITVGTDVHVFNTFGGQVHSHDLSMGSRQSGLSWVEYPLNYTSWLWDSFCDGFGIIAISPYSIYNNTGGLPGNDLYAGTLDYTASIEDGNPWVFNDTATTSFETGWYNFTLGEPGDLYESYLLTVDGEIGQWVNVSVYVEDVDDWNCAIKQAVDGGPQILYWGSLDDTLTGDITGEASFQFGCISEDVTMYFSVQRAQAGEGRLDIAFDEFTTNTLEYMPLLAYQGEVVEPEPDMGMVYLAIGAGVIVLVVVAVVVVLKKKPELLGRFKK